MKELEKRERSALARFFENSTDTLVESCLQGYCGRAFSSGRSAAVTGGDFIYLGGEADGELLKEVLLKCPAPKYLVPMNAEWEECIAHICGATAKKGVRFATEQNADFDLKKLGELAAPPEGFEIKRVDGEVYAQFESEGWSRDFTANFANYGEFERLGLGYAAIYDGRAVAGACSYSVCDGAIEVQIVTMPSFRRRGLARACAAALITECITKGIYPNWDAEHRASLHIAQSLGYKFLREYTAFTLTDRDRNGE